MSDPEGSFDGHMHYMRLAAERAQEIERLQEEYDKQWRRAGVSSKNVEALTSEVLHLNTELSQLKSRQSGVVLPERPKLLDGESPLVTDYEYGESVGRCDMWAEVARLNSSAVSAGSTEVDLQSSGLGYPLAKEQAVQLWHQGFRSEPISVLEAWEAIGHDIGCNPSKEELMDSLRNMSAICRAHGCDMPARAALSAPSEYAAVPSWEIIHSVLRNYGMTTALDGDGGAYPLIDAMSVGSDDVSSGISECEYLADAIYNALLAAAPPHYKQGSNDQ